MSAMTLDSLEVSFEEWHNKTYGTVGVRSLEKYPKEIGLGYIDAIVQAQFFLYYELTRAHAQMVEKVRDVWSLLEIYGEHELADKLAAAIGDAK